MRLFRLFTTAGLLGLAGRRDLLRRSGVDHGVESQSQLTRFQVTILDVAMASVPEPAGPRSFLSPSGRYEGVMQEIVSRPRPALPVHGPAPGR